MDRDETGKDGVLIVNETEMTFTTVDLNIEWDESSSDYNDSNETHHRKTGKDSGGTIEVDGSEAELKAAIMNENGEQRDGIRIQMYGSETEYGPEGENAVGAGDRFTGVTITSFNREFPGGDATTTSVDFVANNHVPISPADA